MLYQVFRMEKMCQFVFTTCSKVRTNIKISQQFLVVCEQIIGEETPTRVQMECAKKKTFGCKKLLGALAEPSEILEGERSDTDTGLLWTDAMQTLDSYMRGLGFFCNVCSKNRWG